MPTLEIVAGLIVLGVPAIAAVEARLERLRLDGKVRAGGFAQWARCTLDAAAARARAGRTDAALRWADTLHLQNLPPTLRAIHAQHVAAFAIGEGKRRRAREALARLRRRASPDVEQSLVAVEGTLEVLERDAAASRRRAEELRPPARGPAKWPPRRPSRRRS